MSSTEGVNGRDDLARVIYGQMADAAHGLIQVFSPSHSFATHDLQAETLLRIIRARGEQLNWSQDAARAYIYRTMETLLIDRWRKRRKERPTGDGAEALGTADPEPGLRMDLLAALVELDRTTNEGLRKCAPAFKAYHFLKYRSRFSREGDEMVDEMADRPGAEARTLAEVAKLLGIPPATAAAWVATVRHWLKHRLRAYEEFVPEEKRRGSGLSGKSGNTPVGGES
jgi:DNA-directed RNA polymerase specialized sigma24 family protein